MRFIRRVVLVGATSALAVSGIASSVPAQAADESLTVMSRNIYLGADVGVALELIPDMPAAAQFMWEQVAQTDFTSRAPVLATELAREQPDVVAIQEATTWLCRSSIFGSSTVVFDFTEQLLEQTRATGVKYVIASHDGEQAFNPGYSIPVLPFLTTVRDPQTFQPLFGSDEAACGFTIGDALLVRADLADNVMAVGRGDYDASYSVVPVLFNVQRGYTWADLQMGDSQVRIVTTHLESVWDEGVEPYSIQQTHELIEVLSAWSMPVVVIGDFNSDPRDPRPVGAPNPGLQPDTTTGCSTQVVDPSPSTADPSCNAYWAMVDAGFEDAGPDSLDPANATWGASALLAGPDPDRLVESSGNPYGYSDRLDYVFTAGGARATSAHLIGDRWPDGTDTWTCTSPDQLANAQAAAELMGVNVPQRACLPTDHVGLLVAIDIPNTGSAGDASSDESVSLGVAVGAILAVLAMSAAVSLWAVRRSRTP